MSFKLLENVEPPQMDDEWACMYSHNISSVCVRVCVYIYGNMSVNACMCERDWSHPHDFVFVMMSRTQWGAAASCCDKVITSVYQASQKLLHQMSQPKVF